MNVRRLILGALGGAILLSLGVTTLRADGVSEMAAFSVFGKVDPAELAKSDVKVMRGPAMNSSRLISVQSCYVSPRPPAQEMAVMRDWNPAKHAELKIYLHSDLPSAPGPDAFAALRKAPGNSSVRNFVSKTEKLASDLQISQDEAKKFKASSGGGAMPEAVATFWMNILSGRARAFVGGGTAAEAAYSHTGQNVKPNEELNALLREQGKVRGQFGSFLGSTGIGRGAGAKAENYWELLDVDGDGVVTLGATYRRGSGNGPYQIADVLYYASGGYYVALTLYQMWPIEVGGRPSTLVWRGDFISAEQIAELHGVERMASESAMIKDITKAVTLFRRDTSSPR